MNLTKLGSIALFFIGMLLIASTLIVYYVSPVGSEPIWNTAGIMFSLLVVLFSIILLTLSLQYD